MRRSALLPASSRCTNALTLLELLVVIGIIGILAAMLLPALSRAKANGKLAACLNNLKQIAHGVHRYANDFGDILFPITNRSSYPPPSRFMNGRLTINL
jgi:prepilin-type N-terminal cleavage/methylation domain-containing protein